MRNLDRLDQLRLAEAARRAHHAGETRFGELRKIIWILARVDHPNAVRAGLEHETCAGRHAVDVGDQPFIAAQLREGVGHGLAALTDQADDRELVHLVGFAEMKRERRIAGQFLARPHQRDIIGEGNAIVLVGQVRRIDSRPPGEQRSIGAFRHRQVQQRPGKTRRDRGLVPFDVCGHVFDTWRHVQFAGNR